MVDEKEGAGFSDNENDQGGIAQAKNDMDEFDEFVDEARNPNIEMFMDVNMTLSAEVGRSRIKLRDLLNLSKGSVVELNKLSGEPVDVMANGKLIAYGEVVSVSGKYGIRITSIASKRERVKQFQDE